MLVAEFGFDFVLVNGDIVNPSRINWDSVEV